ncbi:hypothetical protein BC831DRAFT_552296 [Entophlyctis helioformis]|nr:hypothetical protein BC831DRAFT_552296 [Entophlyctis helioformis]
MRTSSHQSAASVAPASPVSPTSPTVIAISKNLLNPHLEPVIPMNRIVYSTADPETGSHANVQTDNDPLACNSHSLFVSPQTLLRVRLCLLVYTAAFVLWRFGQNKLAYLHFLTNWSWILLLAYLLAATLASHHAMQSKAAQQTDSQRASRLGRLLPWLFAASQTLVWLVAVVFWLLLTATLRSAPSAIERLSLINGHAGNLVVATVDLVLCKTALLPRHSLAPATVVAAFLCMVWTVRALFPDVAYPYAFIGKWMDPVGGIQRDGVTGFLTGVGVGSIGLLIAWLFFWVPLGLIRLRVYIATRAARKQ